MANALYGLGREGFLAGDIDWDANTIRATLIRTSGGGGGPYYTLVINTDNDLADIDDNADARPVGTGISTGEIIGTKSVTLGTADGGDITYSAVGAGDAIQLIVVYQDTGAQATSRLIAALDTGTGLPVTPNGGDITVVWDSGADKIFTL